MTRGKKYDTTRKKHEYDMNTRIVKSSLRDVGVNGYNWDLVSVRVGVIRE